MLRLHPDVESTSCRILQDAVLQSDMHAFAIIAAHQVLIMHGAWHIICVHVCIYACHHMHRLVAQRPMRTGAQHTIVCPRRWPKMARATCRTIFCCCKPVLLQLIMTISDSPLDEMFTNIYTEFEIISTRAHVHELCCSENL